MNVSQPNLIIIKMADKKNNRYSQNKQVKIATGYNEIHVFLQQSSALCLNKNEDIEAMISVQAFGKIQYSKVLSKVGYESRVWGEHFYFSKTFKKQEAEALQKSLIVIKAWDHKKILSSALIGQHELSVAKIYSNKDHLLSHTWLALSNVTRNFGQVSGMVKVSINVTNQNDEAQTLQLQPYNASQKEKSILMAANISRKSHQLTVDIYEGNNLKPVAGDTTDAYIGLQFGMIYERTKTIVNECNPVWKETLQIPVHYPAYVNNVILRLIDANVFKSKEVMGSCYISLQQLKSQQEGRGILANDKKKEKRLDQNLWVNFYGPQIQGENNQYKHKYSIYPDLAPYYVGSVLLRAILQPNSNPKKAHTLIEDLAEKLQLDLQTGLQIKVGKPPRPLLHYKVHVKFQLGMNLPIKFSSYAMAVRVGKQEHSSKMKKVKHGFVMWNNQKEFDVYFYENQHVPDIFFYLINEDDDKVCFYRTPVKFHKETNQFHVQNTWRKLKPDLTKIKAYSEEAGYVKFQLTMTLVVDKKAAKKTLKNIIAQQSERSFSDIGGNFYSQIYMNVPCKLLVDLYCAQNLLAGDEDGSADPYFKFIFQDSAKVSSVKNSTINPVYIQRMILEGTMGEKNEIMPLTVTVFNKNPLSDQAIGTCYINLKQQLQKERISINSNYNTVPQWFDIQIDGHQYGKFLAGITIIRGNKIRPMNAIGFLEDELATFQINLMVLGLRCLKSSNSIISIRKPIIRFDFQSLYVYSSRQIRIDGTIQQNTQDKQFQRKQRLKLLNEGLSPNSPGSSVNIQLSERVKMKLPKNTQFWPKLWARVNNSVIGDLYEPHIGYFYVDLKHAYMRTKKLQQQYTKQMDDMKKLNKPFQVKQKLIDIDKSLLSSLLIFVVKNVKYNWHQVNKDIQDKLNRLKKKEETNLILLKRLQEQNKIKTLDEDYIVIMPHYIYVQEEDIYQQQFREFFDRNRQYIKVGYDNKSTLKKTKQHRNRHYRYCLDKPFEKYYEEVNGIEYGVYSQIPIKKGRIYLPDQKNMLNNSLMANEQKEVGFYKGNCLIIQKNEEENELDKKFFEEKEEQLKSFLKKQSIKMYLYILNAFSIPKKKGNKLPRPYLVVKLSEHQEINFSQKNDQQTCGPEFNLVVKKDLFFPLNSEITIQIWDRGFLNVPQLIGEAVIYAQNRVFYQFGKMKFNNPAETHPLKVMQSRQQQGKVRFWVDFVPNDFSSLYKEYDISCAASPEFQIRVIIWGCSDVSTSSHDITDMVDLYVTCGFNGQIKETDVHYRTESGDGSFNWRMVFPVKLPLMDSSLTFKVYDKGLVGKDGYLAAGQKNIGSFLQKAHQNQMSVKLYEGEIDMKAEANLPCQVKKDKSGTLYRYDIFNVNLTNKSQEGFAQVNAAKVMVSIQILPKAQAQKKKVGQGRKDPNQFPNLPQPSGRLQFSLNPATMLTRLCGKRFKNKILIVIICFLFGTCLVYFFPSIFGSILAKVIKF